MSSRSGGAKRSTGGVKGPSPLTKAEINADTIARQQMLVALDVTNTRESASKTKARIVSDLVSRLEQNDAFLDFADRHNGFDRDPVAAAVNTLVRAWAQDSASDKGLALQEAARQEFHLRNVAANDAFFQQQALERFGPDMPGLRAFVRAVYDHTQAWFASQGVREVPLYRSMQWHNEADQMPEFVRRGNYGEQRVALRPLSSFSVDYATVRDGARASNYPLLIGLRVPVSHIWSTAQTGPGAKDEAEMVVLGGTYPAFTQGYE